MRHTTCVLGHSEHESVAGLGENERSLLVVGTHQSRPRLGNNRSILHGVEEDDIVVLLRDVCLGDELVGVERRDAVGFADLVFECRKALRSVVDVVVERIADYVQRTVLPAVNIGCGEVDVVAACNGLNALRSRRAVACRAFPIIVVVEHVGIVARRHTENEALAILVVNHLAILSVSRERDFVCA